MDRYCRNLASFGCTAPKSRRKAETACRSHADLTVRSSLDWIERDYATAILFDVRRFDSPTHSVDCFMGRVAVEVEWNNKAPFFDRDLNLVLFELRAIDVGVITTRGSGLQKIFNRPGKGASYGRATTHRES